MMQPPCSGVRTLLALLLFILEFLLLLLLTVSRTCYRRGRACRCRHRGRARAPLCFIDFIGFVEVVVVGGGGGGDCVVDCAQGAC